MLLVLSMNANNSVDRLSNRPFLIDLPSEIIVGILTELDYETLLTCKQTCHVLNNLIRTDLRLQYHVELGKIGMEDNPRSARSLLDKLFCIREYRQKWKTINWDSVLPTIYSRFASSCAQVSNEIMAVVDPIREPSVTTSSLLLNRLPGKTRNLKPKAWSLPHVIPSKALPFALFPSQDLLVVVDRFNICDFTLRLLSLSSGEPHPSAINGSISIGFETPAPRFVHQIQISGDFVAFLVGRSPVASDHLLIYNWKSGSLVYTKFDPDLSSFAFVLDTHVLLSYVRNRFLSTSRSAVTASVVFLNNTLSSEGTTLLFPRFTEFSFVVNFTLISAPGSAGVTIPTLADPTHTAPFHSSELDRLIFIRLDVMYNTAGGSSIEAYVLILPVRRFLRDISSQKGVLEWETWGPKNTRLLRLPHKERNVLIDQSAGYGMRYAYVCYNGPNSYCALYEFDTSLARSSNQPDQRSKSIPKPVQISYGTGPAAPPRETERLDETYTMIEATEIDSLVFEDTIHTELPYRKRLISTPNAVAVVITGDNLLLFGVRLTDRNRTYYLSTK